MLLRSMQQAVYSPDNVGHFGLAYEAYAHFTSPIRRYPDLLTHRAIKAVLAGKKYEPKGIDLSKLNTTVSNAARKQMAKDKAEGKAKDEKDLTIWDALGVHCSANERRADEASRDVENWLKCYFMQDKLGESFTGIVAGVTTFGIFVQLDELYVEGLVHVTALGEDYFQYDEARHLLRGERTGRTFGLTDRVTVQVAKVDLEARKIDLVLADDANAQSAPAQPQERGREKGRREENKSDRTVRTRSRQHRQHPRRARAAMPWLKKARAAARNVRAADARSARQHASWRRNCLKPCKSRSRRRRRPSHNSMAPVTASSRRAAANPSVRARSARSAQPRANWRMQRRRRRSSHRCNRPTSPRRRASPSVRAVPARSRKPCPARGKKRLHSRPRPSRYKPPRLLPTPPQRSLRAVRARRPPRSTWVHR
jgi:ribonuclease R